MNTKIGRNTKCHCGSGLKYKNCCFKNDLATENPLINNRQEEIDKIPFDFSNVHAFASVKSKNGNPLSMIIGPTSVSKNNVTKLLLDDEITLSTNEAEGDKIEKSFSQINIPQSKELKPELVTKGNATIKNSDTRFTILPLIKTNLKITSPKGNKVQIKIGKQRNENFDYFDVLFLMGKRHPHIAFYPDGNWKYIGQRGVSCELNTLLEYDLKEQVISPSVVSITNKDLDEKLIMKFEFNNINKTVSLLEWDFN